jgi:pilus assembly protein Flp/PilA
LGSTADDALWPVGAGLLRSIRKKEQTMSGVFSRVHRFIVSEDGPTAVEYAVMLGLIVVAIVGVVTSLATSVSGTFSTVSSTLGS